MNTYEQKQEDRKERYLELSQKFSNQSNESAQQARELSGVMPFGQPILIGHHSEGKHRRHIEKLHNTMSKSLELDSKAGYYEDKAQSVGTGGVSSDDPDAVKKLTAKIESMKWHNEQMKESNKLWRKLYNTALKTVGGSKERVTGGTPEQKDAFYIAITELNKTDAFSSNALISNIKLYAYPPYSTVKPFSPETAEIRRLEKRVKDLRAVANFDHKEIVKESYRLVQDPDENRLMFYFDGKPEEAIRKILKAHSFKWSPSRKAWVRMITGNALYSVKRALIQLDALENVEVVA